MASGAALQRQAVNGSDKKATRVLRVNNLKIPRDHTDDFDSVWEAERQRGSEEVDAILEAAEALRNSNVPVAFPTETVYGLGADATRSEAVKGIYKAKQRPSDNPLIVHISSREQLERLLLPPGHSAVKQDGTTLPSSIPPIYEPLIARFWPGPLTILIPNPKHSPLAPEVTSNLTTFGVRMPSSPLARLLIKLTDRPLAAPSANASTKPSPTTAQHVFNDLQGRIDIILDGGPCGVGVESTVVDGLSQPPAVLRPGGIGIEEIRACPGWESVRAGYKDGALQGKTAPRAPGMKYRHYSPKAKVVLFEANQDVSSIKRRILQEKITSQPLKIGVIRTQSWQMALEMPICSNSVATINGHNDEDLSPRTDNEDSSDPLFTVHKLSVSASLSNTDSDLCRIEMLDISLGSDTHSIARGLFSALRSLDNHNVSVIYVEGIPDTDGDLAAAIMNRLRKAAEEEIGR